MNNITKKVAILALTGIVILGSTCDLLTPGFGSKVDITAPTASFASPTQNAYVHGTLSLQGKASDDRGLAGLTISYKNAAGQDVVHDVTVTDGQFSINLPSGTSASDDVPDGEQTFTLTAKDTSGKETQASLIVYVDNLAPTVLVTVPQTYGAAARPIFGPLIDLKGEVYDASPISSVVVSLWNAAGTTQLASKQADGTNTWSVRFTLDDTTYPDLGVFAYKVLVTDKAGNQNQYSYHSQDIYLIKPANALFPTVDQLGQVDQKHATDAATGIDYATLYATRMDIPGKYGDFTRFADATLPEIHFSNLDDTATNPTSNVLSNKVPINGYINPGPANNLVIPGSIRAWLMTPAEFGSLGGGGPTAAMEVAPADIKRTNVGSSVNYQIEPRLAGVYLPSGSYYVRVQADSVGGSRSMYNPGVPFTIDGGAPVISSIVPAKEALLKRSTFSSGPQSGNTGVQVTVTVTDDNQVDTTSGQFTVGWSTVGAAGPFTLISNSDIFVDAGDAPPQKAVRSAQLVLGTGISDIWFEITAHDNVGTTARDTAHYTIDETPPTIAITDPVAAPFPWLSGSIYPVKGTASDAGGVQKVEYSLDYTNDGNNANDTWITAVGTTNWTASIDLNVIGETANKTVFVRATDNAGSVSNIASRSFGVDQAPPQVTETAVGSGIVYKNGDFNLSGAASDSLGLKLVVDTNSDTVPDAPGVELKIGAGGPTPIPVLSGNWTVPITVDPGHSGDGTLDYVITATDLTGQFRSVTRTITIDTKVPTVDISSISPVVGTNKVNGVINFTASASDENGLNGVRYWILPAASPAPVFSTAGATDWVSAPYTASFDTTTLTDGNYSIWIVARDKAGNEQAFSQAIVVDQSSDNPVFALTNMDQSVTGAAGAAANLQETNAKLTATISDDDMIDASTIEIRIDANNDGDYGDGGVENWTAVSGPPAGNGKNLSFEHVFPLAIGEGVKNFQVRAYDLASAKAGKPAAQVVLGPIYFAIDRAPPTVVVSAPPSGSYRNADFFISGTAGDANGLKTADLDSNAGTPDQEYVAVSMDGSFVGNAAVVAGVWSMPVTVPASGLQDGNHDFSILATDSFNKTNTAAVSIVFDTKAPTGTISNPSADGSLISTTSYSFDGTAGDIAGGSGVKKVQFSTNYTNDSNDSNDTWQDATGQTNWNAVIADLNTAYVTEGNNKLIGFRFEDNAGNVSASIHRSFVFDKAIPTVTISGAANVDTNSGFSISGSAADSNGVQSVVVTQSKDGGAAITVTPGATGPSGAAGSTPWSLINLPRDPASIATQLVADGSYVYQVTSVDVAGRSSIIATVTVRVDQTAPDVLTIVDPAAGQTGINSLSGAAYIFKGIASDAGLGVAKVYYLIDTNAVAPAGIAGYSTLNVGNGNWSFTSDLDTDGPGADTGMAEGRYYIHVKAEDSAGNRTADGNAVTVMFDIDQAKPDLTETALNTSSIVNKTTGFSLSGTSADTNGVQSVTVTQGKDGAAAVAVSTNGVTGTTSWTLSNLPRDPASIGNQDLSDGSYVYVITVTDLAGKTTTLTRTALLDRSAPTVSISSPAVAEVANSSSFTVAGTASDGSGSGVTSTEYSLDGTNWFALSGTNNWNKSINLGAEGTKTLSVRATDAVGNVSSVVTRSFNLDLSPPTLSESMVGSGTAKRSVDFFIGGTANDTNGLALGGPGDGVLNGMPYVEVSENGAAAVKVGVSGGNWNYAKVVSPTHSGDGEVTFVVTATDIVGRSTSVTRIVNIDSLPPTVSLNPGIVSGLNSSVNKVNGTVSFRFSADDTGVGLEKYPSNYSVPALANKYRAYYTVALSSATVNQAAADIRTWTPISSASSIFNFSFDSTTYSAGNYTLYVGIFDSVGTVSSVDGTVTGSPNFVSDSTGIVIDQESDRPGIAFDNLNIAAVTNPENGFGSNPNILMTIQDDDTVKVSDLEYRLDVNNDGDFSDQIELGTADDGLGRAGPYNGKWEDESVWYPVDDKPASNGSLVQAKIKLTGIPQGFFRLQVRARDPNNAASWTTIFDNTSDYSWQKSDIVRFSVDYGPPSIVVTAPTASTFNSNFQLVGSATDQLGVFSVRYTLDGGSTYTTVMSGGSLGNSPYNFNVTVDTSSLVTGDYTLQVEATDMGSSTATQQIPITIDKTAPTVTILQPGAASTLNGAGVAVSGQATDNRSVGAVFLWHGKVSASDPALPSMTSPGVYNAGGYTQLGGTSIWNATIDTTAAGLSVVPGTPVPEAYRIRVVAIDAIGNVGPVNERLVSADQEADRPQVSFSNLSLFSTSRLALGNLSIIGTVSDDDSVKATGIQIAIDRNGDGDYNDTDEGFVPISQPPSGSSLVVSWVHEITDLTQEGLHHVKVRAQDVNQANGDYSTGYGWVESPSVAFFIDNGPPALDVTAPTLSQRINQTQFTVTGATNDTNGIKKVVIWVDDNRNGVVDATDGNGVQDPGESITLGDPDPGIPDTPLTTDNTTYNISQLITGLTDGVKTLRVSSYDSSDALTVRELTVVVDTTAPSATVSNPSSGGTLNGTVQVLGTATDNYEVSKVYYNLQLTAAAAPVFPGAYTLLTGQTYAWNFPLDTTSKPDGAYTLRLVVQDGAGNNNASSPSSVNFNIDQNTDKPVIHVLTLDEAGTAVQNLLPGSLQIGGTVQDDDSVDKTKIQIRSRTLPAGSWSAWANVSGQPSSNTAFVSWSHNFSGFTDGQYEFEVRAADTNDTAFGTYSSSVIGPVQFAVDLSLPNGSITAPAQASFQRAAVIPISGMSGDASGVKHVSIAYNTTGTYGAENVLYDDTNAADGYVTSYPWSTSFNVDTATHANDGQVYYRVTITDAFDKVRTYEQYFTVDTTAPTVGFQLPASGATVNGSVLFRGTTTDTNQVAGVYYKINNSGPGTWAPGNNLTTNGWTLMSGTFNWQQRFKSTTIANGAATIYIVAEDLAGNRTDPTDSANQLSFTVNQNSNLPVVTLSTANNSLLDNSGTITGTVTDDDGVDTSTLQISFDGGTTWQAVSNPGSNGLSVSFSHSLSGLAQREAAYNVKVRVNDIGEDFDGGDFSGPQDIAPVQGVSSAISIYKDDAVPSAAVGSIDNGLASSATLQGVYINDRFTLTGTATDGVRVANVEGRIDVNNDGDFNDGAAEQYVAITNTGTNYSTWSWAETGLSLSVSSVNVELRVTDALGRQTTQAYTLLVDTTAPVISISSTALNPDTTTGAYNGSYSFTGSASDNVIVSKVFYKFATTASGDPGAPTLAFTGWTQAASTYSWTAPLDTVAAETALSHTQGTDLTYSLWTVAVDSAGNIAARQHIDFTINQNSNKPVITLSTPTAAQVLGTGAKALGSVTDDRGLASISIRIDTNNDGDFNDGGIENYTAVGTPATVSGRSITFENLLAGIPLADGFYKLQIRARDTGYTGAGTPFDETQSAVIDFSIDTLPPSLSVTQIDVADRYPADGVSVSPITSNFNGRYINNDMVLTMNASDASGIASVQVSVDGGTTWLAATNTGGNVYTRNISILGQGLDGTQNFQYRATDNNGKVTSGILTLIVDTSQPVVGFTSPSSISTLFSDEAPNVNGTVTIFGTVSDSSAITSVAIAVGKGTPHSLTVGGNNLSWQTSFSATIYQNATDATETSLGSNVWRLPVIVTTYDYAGNRTQTTGYVDLDPNGDKPIVTITSPAANASVTGIITLTGTVADDDGTSGTVDIDVDANNNGSYADGGDQHFTNVTVSNGAWSQQINTGGTLTGTIRFQVTPKDSGGILGDPMNRVIFIDSSLPQIVGYNGSAETGAPTPATGSRQSGTITVRALFKDDDTIPAGNLQVSLDGGSTYVAISTQPGYSLVQLADAGGKKRYDVQFSVNTATYFTDNSGNGSLSVILQITDNTYKPAVASLSYAVDNRPPEAVWNYDSSLTSNNGLYTFSGTGTTNNKFIGSAKDGGSVSGISYVDMFLVKGGNILNPKTGSGVSAPTAVTADNLYAQIAFTAGNVNAGTDVFTIDRTGFGTVNNNLPVRFYGSSLPSGIVDTALYYVRDVAGTTFRIYTTPTGGSPVDVGSGSGTLEYAVTGVPFTTDAYTSGGTGTHYAVRIDKRTELGSNDSNGNGDADGFQESLKDKGGYDEWFAYVNTTVLPDGPLTIYFVATDENGNKVISSASGQISNNPPSVPQVSVNGTTLSASPWKVKTSGTSIPIVVTATDSGTGPNIASTGWSLQVTGRYGNGTDAAASAETSYGSTWYYNSAGGAVRDYSVKGSGTSLPVTGTVNITISGGTGLETNFQEGYWYRLVASATDTDGNVASQEFYLRINNSDVTAPTVTLADLDQTSVAAWTSKTTPLSMNVPAANISSNAITLALPSWITANTKVMFTGNNAPASLSAGTVYYITNIVAGTSFQLSATSGGSALTFSGVTGASYNLVSGGHVEAKATSLYDNATQDADVSGTVKLTGTAFDDTDVKAVGLQLDGVGATVSVAANVVTATAHGLSNGTAIFFTATTMPSNLTAGTLYYVISSAANTFSVASTPGGSAITTTGGTAVQFWVAASLSNQSGNAVTGYTYNWTYYWDSARIATIAKKNVVVKVNAVDLKTPAPNATSTNYTVDVLPYILSITDSTGLSSDVLRGATGKYSVSNNGNSLTVRGYNLSPGSGTPAVYLSPTSDWTGGTSVTGAADATYPSNQITVAKNWTRSGYLTLVLNSEGSANNFDDNTQSVNSEVTTDPRTAQWNDDRYVWVWGITPMIINTLNGQSAASQTYSFPTMVMNGSQPEFSYVDENKGFVNYTVSDSAAIKRTGFRVNRYATMAQATISGTLQRFILTDYDTTYGVSGNSTGFLEVTGFGDQGNDVTMTNAFSPSASSADGTRQWMTIQGNDYYDGTDTQLYRVANRFGYPKMVASASSIAGGANIYVAYYDSSSAQTTFRNLNFVSFRMAAGANTQEVSSVNLTNSTKANYNGKYFTVFSGTVGYDVWFDVTGSDAVPTGSGATVTKIRVNISATAASNTAILDAVITAVRANAAFNATAAPSGAATQNITSTIYGNTTNIANGNINTATVVGSTATVTAGASGSPTGNLTTITNDYTKSASVMNITGTANGASSQYIDMAKVGTTGSIAIAYYDAAAAALKLAYSTNAYNVTGVAGTDNLTNTGATWNNITIDSSAGGDVGRYVSIVYDGSAKLYVAYYDFNDESLKMARISWNGSGTPSVDGKVFVDKYLATGSWTKVGLITDSSLTGQSSAQPFISYYANLNGGSKKPMRIAFPKFDATTGALSHGTTTSGADDEYSGSWEVIAIPAYSVPKGGADEFQQTQLGTYTNNTLSLPVVGWTADQPEYGKLQPNN